MTEASGKRRLYRKSGLRIIYSVFSIVLTFGIELIIYLGNTWFVQSICSTKYILYFSYTINTGNILYIIYILYIVEMFWAFYIKYPMSTINLSYIIYIERIIGIEYNNRVDNIVSVK